MKSEEIIYGIRGNEKQRARVIQFLYKDTTLRNSVKNYILGHFGSEEDVNIVFDDMLVQFIKTVFSNRAFSLDGPIHAYLMGIVKHLWYAESRKKMKDQTPISLDQLSLPDDTPPQIDLLIHSERKNLLHSILNQISRNCKEVLMYWANGYTMLEIAERLNYQSEGMARKKKSNCMKELLQFVHNNPQLKKVLQ